MLLSFKHVYYYYYDYNLNVYQSDRCGHNTSTQPHTIYTHTALQIPTQYDRLWENTLIYVSYMYDIMVCPMNFALFTKKWNERDN